MNRKIFSVIVGCLSIGAMSASALAVPLKSVMVKGQLLDMNCYSALGATGRGHGKMCGRKCLLSGAPAGILVHGRAWVLDVNPKPLAPYVGLMIEAKGNENTKDHVLLPTMIKVKYHGHWKAVKLIPLFMPVR
jgi:hypothetical protein